MDLDNTVYNPDSQPVNHATSRKHRDFQHDSPCAPWLGYAELNDCLAQLAHYDDAIYVMPHCQAASLKDGFERRTLYVTLAHIAPNATVHYCRFAAGILEFYAGQPLYADHAHIRQQAARLADLLAEWLDEIGLRVVRAQIAYPDSHVLLDANLPTWIAWDADAKCCYRRDERTLAARERAETRK